MDKFNQIKTQLVHEFSTDILHHQTEMATLHKIVSYLKMARKANIISNAEYHRTHDIICTDMEVAMAQISKCEYLIQWLDPKDSHTPASAASREV
jgi:hypothetical protein